MINLEHISYKSEDRLSDTSDIRIFVRWNNPLSKWESETIPSFSLITSFIGMLFALTVTSLLTGSLAQATLVDLSLLSPPTLLRAQLPSITHEFNDLLWKRQQSPLIRTTTATQPQLALGWPSVATWSSLSQPIQLIANCPPISTGFVAIAIFTILAFSDQLNVVAVFILLSAVFSFLAGILELVNLISTEASPNGKTRTTAIATAAFFVGGTLFKYVYLFFRLEPAMSNRTSLSSRQDVIPPTPPIWAAPSWDGLGSFAKVLKIFVFMLILTVTVLETVWKIGIISSPFNFLQFLRASATLQMVLLSSALDVSSTVKELGPVLIGNGVGFASQIMDLEITAFSETPLGRYMILIQVYFYIIDAAIHCARSETNQRSDLQITQIPNANTKGIFALPTGSSFAALGSMDEARNAQLISLAADSPTAPAFKSLRGAPVLPEISTLTQLSIDRNSFNLQDNYQGILPGDSPLSPRTRLSRDVYITIPPPITQPSQHQEKSRHTSDTATVFDAAERPSEPDLVFITTLDNPHNPMISTRNSNLNYNGSEVRSSFLSRPDHRGSKVMDDLGPLNSIPASTIFSKYYMGAYDDDIPPPLPTSYMINGHEERSESQINAIADLSGPLPSSTLPLFPHQAAKPALRSSDLSSVPSASADYSGLPSSSFSSIIHHDGPDRSSWGDNSSFFVGLPAPLHLKESDTISSAVFDTREERGVNAPPNFVASQPNILNVGASSMKPQEPINFTTPLGISTSGGKTLRPSDGNLKLTSITRQPVVERLMINDPEEIKPRFGRQGGSQIDVTSFIGDLTAMEDASRNRLLDFPDFPQSPRRDMFRNPSLLGTLYSPCLPQAKSPRRNSVEVEIPLAGNPSQSRLSGSSTIFTASPTSSIQIIDLMGHPILRDLQSSPNHLSSTKTSEDPNDFVTLEGSEEEIEELQAIYSPSYNINPDILATLPTHLSNSSLFQTTEIFENPRPAPVPSKQNTSEEFILPSHLSNSLCTEIKGLRDKLVEHPSTSCNEIFSGTGADGIEDDVACMVLRLKDCYTREKM
ncbi:hypothetical protein DFH28DRAFT_1077524 [Melampsora americana]|nr:hypothetical protein DFH28DRAFT_1077524 [Melampsora americana]